MKWILILVPLVLVLVLFFGLYTAVVAGVNIPGLSSAFRAGGSPPSQEQVAAGRAVERKIDTILDEQSGFSIELTDQELTALLASKLDPSQPIRDAEASVTPEEVRVSGHLNGKVPVPFSSAIDVKVVAGELRLGVKSVSVGFVPLPGAARRELDPLVNDAVAINRILREAGARETQEVVLQKGKATIIGVHAGGKDVSDATKQAFVNGYRQAGSRPAPVAPGANTVPPGSVAQKAGPELYLALGDSLAAGVGAPRPLDAYVSRFHAYLERTTGRQLGLLNLGVSGESSISVYRDQLPRALQEINSRRNDGNPATRVSFVTLNLGANDLLVHLGSTDCQNDPRGEACRRRVDAALASFTTNFDQIVSQLRGAMEPDAKLSIMTTYNPFDFGIGVPFETYSNEIAERLNKIVRDKAAAVGATLADPYPLMKGNAAAWTLMLEGDIHPNADGYQVLAYSLTQPK